MKNLKLFRLLINNKGMALLIAIVTLVLLVVVTLQFQRTTWAGYRAAYAGQVRGKLEAMVSSGLNMAILALKADAVDNEYDSVLDRWGKFGDDEAFGTMFPEGSLVLKVTDLTGRLPLNYLVATKSESEAAGEGRSGEQQEDTGQIRQILADMLQRLLLSGDFAVEDETQAREIIDAIEDWLDEDDEELEYGAERSYYQSAGMSYGCRNDRLQSVEELLLIRGMTTELLFGSEDHKALADFITIEGYEGKINLATAPKEILMSLDPLITEELADRLIEFRQEPDNQEQLADAKWYLGVSGWPADIVLNENLLTTTSSYFLVEATGVRDPFKKRLAAVIKRDGQENLRLIWKRQE